MESTVERASLLLADYSTYDVVGLVGSSVLLLPQSTYAEIVDDERNIAAVNSPCAH